MKKTFLTIILSFAALCFFAQDASKYYEEGLAKAQAGEFEESIKLFSKTIELRPKDHYAWYNRGMAKLMLNQYKEALVDFEEVVRLKPDYKKGWLNRGTAKKHLGDLEGAIADYTRSIKADSTYAEAYYNRGLVLDDLNKKDSACTDYRKALELGLKSAQKKVDKCNDTSGTRPVYSIKKLSKTAEDEKYGFTPENPVKVGTGPKGGPANQKAYLDLLRDVKGNPVSYKRISSCCQYQSPNGFLGMAMLDKYEITYKNEKGKKKKATIYLTFYDYDEPMILFGFKTAGQ